MSVFKLSRQTATSATIILTISILVSNILGLVREVLLAKYYGTGKEYDIFVLAQYLPSMINAAFYYGIPSVFVPLYYSILSKEGEEEGKKFQSGFLSVWMVTGIIICVVTTILSEFAIPSMFPHLSISEQESLIWAIQILMMGTIASLIFMLIRAILTAHKHFLFPSISIIALNIVVVFVLINWGKFADLKIIIYALSAGMVLQLVSLLLFLNKSLEKLNLIPKLFSKRELKTLIIAIPIVSIEILWGVFFYLDGYFATLTGTGGASAVNYALVLFRLPYFLFGITVGSAMLPFLSESFVLDDENEINRKISIGFKVLLLICSSAAILFIMYGEIIIQIFFARGAFNDNSVKLTSEFLIAIAPSSFFLGAYPLLIRLMNSIKKNNIITLIFISGIVLKYLLFTYIFSELNLISLAWSINISLAFSFLISFAYAAYIVKFDFKNLLLMIFSNFIIIAVVLLFKQNFNSHLLFVILLSLLLFLNKQAVLFIWQRLSPSILNLMRRK